MQHECPILLCLLFYWLQNEKDWLEEHDLSLAGPILPIDSGHWCIEISCPYRFWSTYEKKDNIISATFCRISYEHNFIYVARYLRHIFKPRFAYVNHTRYLDKYDPDFLSRLKQEIILTKCLSDSENRKSYEQFKARL